jgi:hypothetical protein
MKFWLILLWLYTLYALGVIENRLAALEVL